MDSVQVVEATASAEAPFEKQAVDLKDPSLYFNRELSWIEFNRRVLEEGEDPRHPLLERVKFLAIFSSNLDEFFMIRVSGLKDQLSAGVTNTPPDGLAPAEQLAAVRAAVLPLMQEQGRCFYNEVMPALAAAGIHLLRHDQLCPEERDYLRAYFHAEILPVLTPLAFDPGRPFPHISNLSLNLALAVRDPRGGTHFARVKVPTTLPRLVPLDRGRQQDVGII